MHTARAKERFLFRTEFWRSVVQVPRLVRPNLDSGAVRIIHKEPSIGLAYSQSCLFKRILDALRVETFNTDAGVVNSLSLPGSGRSDQYGR